MCIYSAMSLMVVHSVADDGAKICDARHLSGCASESDAGPAWTSFWDIDVPSASSVRGSKGFILDGLLMRINYRAETLVPSSQYDLLQSQAWLKLYSSFLLPSI